MSDKIFLTATVVAAALTACAQTETADEPSADGTIRIFAQSDSNWPVPPEYQQVFVARGFDPTWEGEIKPGEARVRPAGQPEAVVPLLKPGPCPVIDCEGVWIEQRVAHRHMGATIIRMPCRLAGSDTAYPYRVSISVLRSASDTEGVMYRGCAAPK